MRLGVPRGSRAVVGLGFGLTDPPAVKRLEDGGVDVKLVADTAALAASQFHPKLYLASGSDRLVVLSGSGNLTGGGLGGNVEQYEELEFPVPSADADRQLDRFEQLWDYGAPIALLRRSGDWDAYRQRARDRRLLEQTDRRDVLRLHADTGQLLGRLARLPSGAGRAYLGITHPEWWEFQLQLRLQADRALFWRRGRGEFRALARGGLFFHLVKDPAGREDQRTVRGFSKYPGAYEVDTPESLWRRYGELLGVRGIGELYRRLDVEHGRLLGVIHLEHVTELDRPVTLEELRANGVRLARNIVSGRTLTLEEAAMVLELGGLGWRAQALAAEAGDRYRTNG